MIEGRNTCPQDGTPLQVVVVYDSVHAEAGCGSCRARYPVIGKFKAEDAQTLKVPVKLAPVFSRCPYDQGALLLMHRYGYATMARYKCERPNCIFEITQGCIA